jgi:hypothetical protein
MKFGGKASDSTIDYKWTLLICSCPVIILDSRFPLLHTTGPERHPDTMGSEIGFISQNVRKTFRNSNVFVIISENRREDVLFEYVQVNYVGWRPMLYAPGARYSNSN